MLIKCHIYGHFMTHLPKNCQLLHQQMSTLCFACSTFPTDHNTLYTERHIDYSGVRIMQTKLHHKDI